MTVAFVPAGGLDIVREATGGNVAITGDARHFRLSDAAVAVLRAAGTGLESAPGVVDAGRVGGIRESLVAAGLLVPAGARAPVGPAPTNRRLQFRRVAMVRLHLGRPDRLVAALAPVWAALTRRWALVPAGLIAVLGLVVAVRELIASWGLLRAGSGWGTTIGVIGATLAAAFLHELGHALELSRRGGRPGGVGLMLMWFLPAAYCDVSDVWRIPDRVGRMAVSAAGPAVNLVIGGVLGLLRCSGCNAAWLRLLIMSNLAMLLINSSPFLRTDTYWMIAHWLREPSLLPTARRDAWLLFRPSRRRQAPGFSWVRAAYGLAGCAVPLGTTTLVWLLASA
ncbi:MAG: hypothetical protein ACK5PP_02565 [Acidimicrobiales bacterium]